MTKGAVHDVSWEQARAIARGTGRRLEAETVPVALADRRVCAEAVVSLVDLPGFDASAMDGWAVAGPGPWSIVGTANAGAPPLGLLEVGSAVSIATGAAVPQGTTGIVRTEHASTGDGLVQGKSNSGDIRLRGEECAKGDLLAEAGTELTPAMLGLLSATGHDLVVVTRRPQVDLLVLGDELDESGVPAGGRVRDALGPQVPAWLSRVGADVATHVLVPDKLDSLRGELARVSGDLVITTGGTSAGPRDYLRSAIRAVGGEVLVDEVSVRPGHPMLLAKVGDRPLIALPGNPHAAVVALLTLGLPLVGAMLGRHDEPHARVATTIDIPGMADRVRMVPGRLVDGGFQPAERTAAGMLRGLSTSTGYACIPFAGVRVGDAVDWLPLP